MLSIKSLADGPRAHIWRSMDGLFIAVSVKRLKSPLSSLVVFVVVDVSNTVLIRARCRRPSPRAHRSRFGGHMFCEPMISIIARDGKFKS